MERGHTYVYVIFTCAHCRLCFCERVVCVYVCACAVVYCIYLNVNCKRTMRLVICKVTFKFESNVSCDRCKMLGLVLASVPASLLLQSVMLGSVH
jgi:hypothetical protein